MDTKTSWVVKLTKKGCKPQAASYKSDRAGWSIHRKTENAYHVRAGLKLAACSLQLSWPPDILGFR